MPDPAKARSLERSKDLVGAAVYDREVGASLERVWENVYDWAHLPWLHGEDFSSIEKLDAGPWGWHARVGLSGGVEVELELLTDEAAGHYVTRTLDGPGAPTEIWTRLEIRAQHRTAIRVEFCVLPVREESLHKIGEGYVSLYTRLWDQDEEMMRIRQAALAEKPAVIRREARSESVSLGPVDELRGRLPLVVDHGGRSWRIVEVAGELLAHDIRCPHQLGPLDGCRVIDGRIVCPWHGYVFDVGTGRSADDRELRLRTAPRITIDPDSGRVEVRAGDESAPV